MAPVTKQSLVLSIVMSVNRHTEWGICSQQDTLRFAKLLKISLRKTWVHFYLIRSRDNFCTRIVQKLRQDLDGKIGHSDRLDFSCHASLQSDLLRKIEQRDETTCLEKLLHLDPRINDSRTFLWNKRLSCGLGLS